MTDARTRRRGTRPAAPVVRFRVDFGRDAAIGPGKIALLEEISRAGSLSQAARDLGMSYRRAWLLLASLNTAFREPVAVTATGGRGGGGAQLTPFGRELVSLFRAFERDTQARAAGAFKAITSKARREEPGVRAVRAMRLSHR